MFQQFFTLLAVEQQRDCHPVPRPVHAHQLQRLGRHHQGLGHEEELRPIQQAASAQIPVCLSRQVCFERLLGARAKLHQDPALCQLQGSHHLQVRRGRLQREAGGHVHRVRKQQQVLQ